MVDQQLKYSKEEFARQGKALYDARIRTQVEKDHDGKIVAIDIETGDFEIAEDSISASNLLRQRHPKALAWFVRVGHRTVHRIGSTSAATTE